MVGSGAVLAVLRKWIESARPGSTLRWGLPAGEAGAEEVFVHPLRAEQESTLRNGKSPPLALKLTYLVLIRAAQEEAVTERIADLAFEAMEHPHLMLEPGPLPAQLWTALSLPPQVSLLVSLRTMRERRVKEAPLVRDGVETRSVPMLNFSGRVLTPAGRPLPGVLIALPNGEARATSDIDGRFVVRGLRELPRPTNMRLSKRGRSLDFNSDVSPMGDGIVFTLKEPVDHA